MFSFFGLFVLALVTYYVYRTTRDRGWNPMLWAALTFVFGIAMQFILPILATAVILYIKMGPSGSPLPVRQMDEVQAYAALFSIGGLIISVIGAGAILFFIARRPKKDPAGSAPPPPPPPPTFAARSNDNGEPEEDSQEV